MFKEIGRRFRSRRGEGAAHEGKEKSILLLILKKKRSDGCEGLNLFAGISPEPSKFY